MGRKGHRKEQRNVEGVKEKKVKKEGKIAISILGNKKTLEGKTIGKHKKTEGREKG